MRDLSLNQMIKFYSTEDPEKLTLVTSIFKNATAISVKAFEPHVVSIVAASNFFKDPLIQAQHTETLRNLSKDLKLKQLMVEAGLI